MQLHGNAGRRPRRLVPAMTATAALAMALAACSGSGGTGTQAAATRQAQATSAAAAAASAAAPAANSGLSGRWHGQYSGAYQGHFLLRWHQSGSKLSGRITLSAPTRGTLGINGTVQGSTIRFGTVGSEAITYSGSVSGDSMSGTWKIQAPSGSAGGPWSASMA